MGRKKREKGLDIGDLKLCMVIALGGFFVSFLVLLGEYAYHSYESGKMAEVGSNIIRKVSTASGLSLTSSRRGENGDANRSVNPSIVITETEDTDQESTRSESLRSLPLEVEYGWCNCIEKGDAGNFDAVSTSLGDISKVTCRHFNKRFQEE